MNSLPDEITYLQLESVISMLKFFNFMVEKKYEEVVKYIQTNIVFLVNGLQRISTNLRENNQTVMMWYSDHTTITKDENYQYSNSCRDSYRGRLCHGSRSSEKDDFHGSRDRRRSV